MSKLTQEQIDWIVEKREAGWGYGRIAARVGVSDGAVYYQCLKNGAVSPRQRFREAPVEGATVVGFGRTVRHFSRSEDERLLELAGNGLKLAAIADALGRARTSVRIRLLTLGLREEMAA